MSEGVETVVTEMPVEVSMVTEVSSESMELPSIESSTNNLNGVMTAHPNVPIASQSSSPDKGIPLEAVQYEVVTSDSNVLITGNKTLETTPTIEIAPPTSEIIPPGRRLSYSMIKDEAIAQHMRDRLSRGEKVTTQQLCQYAKSVIQEENPGFSASSGWAQRFITRHLLDIGKHKPSNHKSSEHRGRPLSYSAETDRQLADYVRARISEGQTFTNAELRRHAREVVNKENPSFTGSASWAQNFLHRHKISLQSLPYDNTDSTPLLTQPTPSLADNPIGPAAEITPTTSHSSMTFDPSQDETMKTALAILAGENIDPTALQTSLSDIVADPVSLVDLLTNAQQLQDGPDDGGVSLIASGLESPSGNIYLNLGGTEGFASGFSTQVDPSTQVPTPPQEPPKAPDVVAQASRPLSYTRETDQQLARWVQDQQAAGRKVTFASLRAQAKKLICQENPNFNASIGWVTPFLLRHNLDLNLNKKRPKEPQSEATPPVAVQSENGGSDTPILTSDLLATAIATSLVEQTSNNLPSLAEQAKLVLAQSGLATQTETILKPSETIKGKEKKDKSRNRHTLAEKLEVVRLMKEFNVAAHYVCRTLGIANSTFAGWTKLVSQKGAELEALSSNRKRVNVRGQGRPLSYNKETDEAIANWVRAQQQLGAQITPAELGKYATGLIAQESPSFTASSGWQQKFLQRHNLHLHSSWGHKTPLAMGDDKLAAEDQTSIPAPIQTEEVVANEFKPLLPEWQFGSEVDKELAKWVKDQVSEHGSFAVSSVCSKAEEMSRNIGFQANLGWAFKFLHQHNIMLDPKPTISQLCATALNRKRSSTEQTTTPKKHCPSAPADISVSPSTGNLCEALLALSNQSSSEESSSATMQAAIQTLQSAVVHAIQQQHLEEGGSPEIKGQSTPPAKEKKIETPNSHSSNTYFHKPAREFSSDEKEEVVRYANATTLQKAASKYGVAAPTVWRWRVELKLHQPKYTTMQKRYIIKFAEANSLKEASTRYGISGKTIQNWRKSFVGDGDLSSGVEDVPLAIMATESIDPHPPNEVTGSEVVTYDTQNFQFIVDGGEVVESRRPELPPSQGLADVEPLSLEVTNEVDIENVGMEYDIVSSEGHAAKPRCTPEEKEHILQFALDHSVREASNKYGISQGTLYYWKKNMQSSGSSSQTTPTLTTTPAQSMVNISQAELLASSSSEHYTTSNNPLPNDSITYVNFLNTVSSLLSSDAEQDKSKSSHILHSPTDVLVTPFTPHTDIETSATVTVVTTEGGAESANMEVVEQSYNQLSMPSMNKTDELGMPNTNESLSMPSSNKNAIETISAEDVDVSQTVELVDSEVTEITETGEASQH